MERFVSIRTVAELIDSVQQLFSQPAFRRMFPVAVSTGFTIVELLIVVVIIGVLAAIVTVAYNGVTKNARDTSVQSDLKNVQKVVELYRAENGLYPTTAQLAAYGGVRINTNQYEVGNNNFYYCVSTGRTRFAVGATAETSRRGFALDSRTGLRAESSLYGASTCPNTPSTDPLYGTNDAYYSSTSSAPASSGCSWGDGPCTWGAWIKN